MRAASADHAPVAIPLLASEPTGAGSSARLTRALKSATFPERGARDSLRAVRRRVASRRCQEPSPASRRMQPTAKGKE